MAICSNDERDSGSHWRTAINTYIEQACPIDSATKSCQICTQCLLYSKCEVEDPVGQRYWRENKFGHTTRLMLDVITHWTHFSRLLSYSICSL